MSNINEQSKLLSKNKNYELIFENGHREWTTNKYFSFQSAGEKITNNSDVAYIFQALQSEAVEHAFCVFVKADKSFNIQWISTGTAQASLIDLKAILAGALHFEAAKMYMVHNHPSGSLIASQSDIQLTEQIREMMKEFSIEVDQIIINLNSGKYALIGSDEVQLIPQSQGPDIPLTIHSFTKQVFSEPFFQQVVKSAEDAASVISGMRFSSADKLGILLLRTNGSIVANYLIPPEIDTLNSNWKDLMALHIHHGAMSCILYGNVLMNNQFVHHYEELQNNLRNTNIILYDYVQYSPTLSLPTELPENYGTYYSYRDFFDNGKSYPINIYDRSRIDEQKKVYYNKSTDFSENILNEPTNNSDFAKNNLQKKLDDLITSLYALSEVQHSSVAPTTQQYAALQKFPGFGFAASFILNHELPDTWKDYEKTYHKKLEEAFFIINNQLKLTREQRLDVIDSIKTATTSSFYTPEPLAKIIIDKIIPLVEGEKINVLEPSCGSGVFLAALGNTNHSFQASIYAIEKDILTAEFAKYIHYEKPVIINNTPFENYASNSNKKFELVISNIPFGDFSVYDKSYSKSGDPVLKASTRRIHNYFFLKGSDLLTEKGILAFITTNAFTNSPSNQAFREKLMASNNLIADVALPNNLFASSNTDVGTRLIILQKDSQKKELTANEQLFIQNDNPYHHPLNNYENSIATSVSFETNKYGKKSVYLGFAGDINSLIAEVSKCIDKQIAVINNDITISNTPIKQKIKQDIQLSMFAFDEPVKSFSKAVEKNPASDSETIPYASFKNKIPDTIEIINKSFYRNGWFVTDGEYCGEISSLNNTGELSLEISVNKDLLNYPKYKAFVTLLQLRDSFLTLYNSENSDYTYTNTTERDYLNELYKKFIRQTNTSINSRDNKKLIELTKQSIFFKNLEYCKTNNTFTPVALFSKPIFLQQPPSNLTISEALYYSINNTGNISLPLISSVTGQQSIPEILTELKGEIFLDADSMLWKAKSSFLSGNIRSKMDSCINKGKAITDPETIGHLRNSYKALKDVLPKPIPFNQITIQLGSPWVPIELFERFGNTFFGQQAIQLQKMKRDESYIVSCHEYLKPAITTTFNVGTESRTYNGLHLFAFSLNDSIPSITNKTTDSYGNTISIPDTENFLIIKAKVEQINNGFQQFLMNLPIEEKNRLAERYNFLYNSSVVTPANGSKLALTDMHYFTAHIHQKNAIGSILLQNGGIIDLPPGAGKSLIMFGAAHELKKIGRCNKPLIVCLKANIVQMVEMHRLCYPNDRILYPSEKDFQTNNRDNILYQMANNDWDCIFLTHEQFAEITPNPKIEMDIVQAELDNLTDDLNILTENNPSKMQLKGLIKRKENLTAKLLQVTDTFNRRADILSFDKLGIDKLFIDESQFFKNLAFTTRHTNVAGIGNPDGSARAFNLLVAVRTLQERNNSDFGTTFLTGSTISNSMAEMYLLFKYMIPEQLSQKYISSFDGWSKTFATKSTEFEFAVTTEFKAKTRFREFNNVPELSQLYNSVSFFIPPAELNIKKPNIDYEQIVIKQSATQLLLTNALIKFAKSSSPSDLHPFAYYAEDQCKHSKMLICTDLAKKMTLDIRMVLPSAQDEGGKLAACSVKIAELYQKYDAHKGTQLVFCDSGTPGTSGFNAYQELKNKLVALGIPASEVRFMHEATSDKKKEEILLKTREGEIRVLIGSTRKLGTGVNCQDRVTAIHSLDLPWTPAELDQRSGRGARQGNLIAEQFCDNKVKHYFYSTEKSLDIFRFQLLSTKQSFIDQIKNNTVGARIVNEQSMDENSVLSYGQLIATLTGDPLLIDLNKTTKKILQLEAEKKAYLSDIHLQKMAYENLTDSVIKLHSLIDRVTADKIYLENFPITHVKGKNQYHFVLQDKTYTDTEQFGDALKKLVLSNKFTGGDHRIGSFRGFTIQLTAAYSNSNDMFSSNRISMIRTDITSPISYHYETDFITKTALTAGEYPIYCLQLIDRRLKTYAEKLEETKNKIACLAAPSDFSAFPKEKDLQSLKTQRTDIELKLSKQEKGDQKSDDLILKEPAFKYQLKR